MVSISPSALIGIFFAIVLPAIAWAWHSNVVRRTIVRKIDDLDELHHSTDSVFSTKRTNLLLDKLIEQSNDIHREVIASNAKLTRAIDALTHYIQWSTEQTTGKVPPPYTGATG